MDSASRGDFRGDIQGLRALAVLAVVAYHARMRGITGGYVGVDMFFVISGFLITGRLATELTTDGRIGFARFYARRARRILPASFAVIVLTVVAALAFQPPLLIADTLRDGIGAALYVPNLLFAQRRNDYLNEEVPSPFQQFWSLGVEEQFYLVWPLLLLLAFTLLGRSRRAMAGALTAVTALSLALSVCLTGAGRPWVFFLLPSRAWELGVGALLAISLAAAPHRWDRRGVGLSGWLGLALIAYALFAFDANTAFPGWRAAVPVAGTALVILAGSGSCRLSPRRMLSLPPLVFVGLISYSVYLVHWPLLLITQQTLTFDATLPIELRLCLGASAIPLGWLLYRCVEEPFRTARTFTAQSNRRTLTAAVAVSAVLAVGCAACLRVADARPLDAGFTATPAPLELHPRGTPAVPSNLVPSLRAARDDRADIYRNGCITYGTVPKVCRVGDNPRAPVVALFGDSHAAQFYPAFAALAGTGDIRLDSMARPSCPSVPRPGDDDSTCRVWRSRVVAMLNDHPPDIIVLSNSTHWRHDWQPALRSTIAALPRASRVVVVADTPNMGSTPAICLSAHLRSANDCSRPRSAALNLANRKAERDLSVDIPGVDILDVTGYMCNADYCPPAIGDLLVYRDVHHMSTPFSRALAPVVRAQLLAGSPAIP